MIKFPNPIVWVGGCCYRVPLTRSRKPRKDYPLPSESKDVCGVVFEGEKWAAHRLSYHLNVAPIPRGPANLKEGIVCHHCDNGWCINPSHLYLGTAKQNAQDNAERNLEWRKNRSIVQKRIGFPEVSKEGRGRVAKANRERMLALPKEEHPRTGLKHSEESKKKMSESHKERHSKCVH